MIYKSNYFNIELQFPGEWRLWGWFNSGVADKSNKKFAVKYQVADDDIPKNKDENKLLFSSIYIEKSNPVPIGAELSIAACYREQAEHFWEEINGIAEEEVRTLGVESILGIEAQSLFVIKNMGNYHIWKKIVTWEVLPNLWLEAVIHGRSQENFDRAESVLKSIKKSN